MTSVIERENALNREGETEGRANEVVNRLDSCCHSNKCIPMSERYADIVCNGEQCHKEITRIA